MSDERCAYPTRYDEAGPCQLQVQDATGPPRVCGDAAEHPLHHVEWEGKCSGCGRSGYRFHVHHSYQPPILKRCVLRESAPDHRYVRDSTGTGPPIREHAYVPGRLCPECGGTGKRQKYERQFKHADPGRDDWQPARDDRGRFLPAKPCPSCTGGVVPIEEESHA